MKRWILVLLLWPAIARAHVGSPDVFFEGNAGPYKLFVTIRTPQVIPGIATIEIRSESPDVTSVAVVPMRLTGPGSELPPTPDRAERSPDDPQFFTADLWLMEHGSLQVRIAVDGARGPATVAVPVAASARGTLGMSRGLGVLLFALMIVIALSIVAIIAGAVREATLPPGQPARTYPRLATAIAGAVVVGVIAFGNLWWNAEASTYAGWVQRPWQPETTHDGCHLAIKTAPEASFALDHGHLMHLFVVRVPDLDAIAHLHPQRSAYGFDVQLPALPAGHYALFADVVFENGWPVTGTGTIDIDGHDCGAPADPDDSTWHGLTRGNPYVFGDGTRITWDKPAELHAGVAQPLKFHVDTATGAPAHLEPYMGMVAHAAVTRADASVFAHLHPSGSVAMPALDLAMQAQMGMPMAMHESANMPSSFAIPFGFPQPGDYRVFVQIKLAGAVQTAAFDAHVVP